MEKISFVSPCYNEQDNIYPFYNLVKEVMKGSGYNYEIVFINDGSKDNTYDELKGIYDLDPDHIKIINFLHNFGKESALLAGLKNAEGDYVCTIDSDMQQNPKYAIQMCQILDNNPEVNMVAAKPANEKDSKVLSFIKKCFYKIINTIADTPFQQGVSDFRVFRKNVCEIIVNMPEHNRFSKGIFSWVCPDIMCIDYEVKERTSGQTKWSFFKLLKYAIGGICSFSYKPLLLSIVMGMAELISALIMLAIIIFSATTKAPINYFNYSLISIGLFLFGIQSINIGIMGQYIAKLHTESINRPQYIIKNILKKENKNGN